MKQPSDQRLDEAESSMITQLSTVSFPFEAKDASSVQSSKQREFDLVCLVKCACMCVCACMARCSLTSPNAESLSLPYVPTCSSRNGKAGWCIRQSSPWMSRPRLTRCVYACARVHNCGACAVSCARSMAPAAPPASAGVVFGQENCGVFLSFLSTGMYVDRNVFLSTGMTGRPGVAFSCPQTTPALAGGRRRRHGQRLFPHTG